MREAGGEQMTPSFVSQTLRVIISKLQTWFQQQNAVGRTAVFEESFKLTVLISEALICSQLTLKTTRKQH